MSIKPHEHRPKFTLFARKDVCAVCGRSMTPKDTAYAKRRARAFSAYRVLVGLLALYMVVVNFTAADVSGSPSLLIFAGAMLFLIEPVLFLFERYLYVHKTEFVLEGEAREEEQ